jgi:hypothetical protein
MLQGELNRSIAALRHERAGSTKRLCSFGQLPDAAVILHIAKLAESIICSCIAATLATRLQMNRALHCGHRLYFVMRKLKMISQVKGPVHNRLRRGNMDELIGQLAAKAGIDRSVAEKTIGIILGFLRSEGPSDKVQALIDQIPGAEAAIAASNGGGLARLMGNGLMALGTKLMGLGLGMVEIQTVARELLRFGRDKIGADQMSEIIAGTPGLSQFA